MISSSTIKPKREFHKGQTFDVKYPFVIVKFTTLDEDLRHFCEEQSWRPGIDQKQVDIDDFVACCDGWGKQHLHVIDVHKPGRFPTRVFYTVTWTDPDGKTFGKNRLRICSVEKFRRLTDGFMSHHRGFFEILDRGDVT